MPLVRIEFVEEAFIEKQKDVAARDAMIVFKGSEALVGRSGYSSKNSATTAATSAVSLLRTNHSDGTVEHSQAAYEGIDGTDHS